MAAIHEAFHEEASGFLGNVRHGDDLSRNQAGWLFNDYMLASSQSSNHQICMKRMGRGNVDCLDLGRCQ